MAKRSPILGYNHNVRYRGLVFHVQTEDSGLLSPHLFTHLFHGGVIISTRKLVYDSGSAEDAIKSLMQAQHKAVLKDLKKGSFDDKIDQYLVGTPGLLPRGVEDPGERASDPELQAALVTPPAGVQRLDTTDPNLTLPSAAATHAARTKTAERGSVASAIRTNLPPPPPDPEELNVPTLNDGAAASIAAAVAAANSTTTRMPTDGATVPTEMLHELSPLEIELELDEPDELPRARPRDTDVATTKDLSDGVPQSRRLPGESVPPLPPPPNTHARAQSAGVGAAALRPPPRGPSRPAITPPQVVSRPLAADQRRTENTDAIEVFSPPPPSVEAPPGLAPNERPGQYAQHKRVSQKMPVLDALKEQRSGAVPIPPGLGRPGTARSGSISSSPSSGIPKPVGGTGNNPAIPKPPSRETGPAPVVPVAPTREPSSGAGRARTPTPSRVGTPPTPARTPSASGGVVMTRPAVIVGAPAKPSQPQRVRKAREDEGRGFGQGLISEKSLDEVILAYLSEDADEK